LSAACRDPDVHLGEREEASEVPALLWVLPLSVSESPAAAGQPGGISSIRGQQLAGHLRVGKVGKRTPVLASLGGTAPGGDRGAGAAAR